MDLLSLLPPEMPSLWQNTLLIIVSFLGSATTAAMGIGGGIMVIAVMSAIMPASAVVPIHGVLLLGSNAGRAGLLLKHVDWKIWIYFAIGAVVGGIASAPLVMDIPATLLRLAIASFILYTQWGPQLKNFVLGQKGYILAGAVSTFITIFVGATGPFITTILSKTTLARQAMVGTAAACMIMQHGIKVLVFGFSGFSFGPWLPFLVAAIVAGFAGTLLGTRILGRIPEMQFRMTLKWLLTALAVLLIVMALGGWGA